MTQTTPPRFPPGRYGRRRQPARHRALRTALLLVPVLVAALAVAWLGYDRYGRDGVSASVTRYSEITDTSVTVHFMVDNPGGRAASCRLRARDHDGAEVGYAVVPVPAGTRVPVAYPLATRARAYVVDVLGCTAAP